MGILSDFVIADRGLGGHIGDSISPIEEWPTLPAKGIETVKLARLYCAITGKEYHNDLQKSFELVGGDKDEGPWVFEFPPEILRSIAGLGPSSISLVAERWQASKELRRDGWSASEAADFVRALSAHADEAIATEKSLYLWLSL